MPHTLTTEEETVDSTKIQDQIINQNQNVLPVKQALNYTNIFFIILGHVSFVYVMLTFPWIQKFHMVVYSALTAGIAGFGVTAGAHRLFTHRSYKAKLPLKIILLIGYSMCGHNNLYDWVRDHRTHHKYVETDADPHNSNRGFFFSHVGWLFMKKHPDVTIKGRTIDMTDISGDPLLAWYRKYFIPIKAVFCFILPTIIPHYLWNEDWYTCVVSQCIGKYIIVLNVTWCVNSVAHIYGNKPYDKSGNPTENLAVSIFAMGEGWHNYHHAFPWDYKASEYGRINITTSILDLFGKIGWAYDFKSASDDLIKNVVMTSGDGTHEKYGLLKKSKDE